MGHATTRPAGALAAALMGALIAAVDAAEAKPPKQCAEEIEEFCEDAGPRGGRVTACLRQHLPKLSPACAQALEEPRERSKHKRRFRKPKPSWLNACGSDIQQLCRDIPAGRGSVAGCLRERQGDLSIACRSAFMATPTP